MARRKSTSGVQPPPSNRVQRTRKRSSSSRASRTSVFEQPWFWPTIAIVISVVLGALSLAVSVVDVKASIGQLTLAQERTGQPATRAEEPRIPFVQTIVVGQHPSPATSGAVATAPVAPSRTAPAQLADLVAVVGVSEALKQQAACLAGTGGVEELRACMNGAVAFANATHDRSAPPAAGPSANSVVAVNVASPTVAVQPVVTALADAQPTTALPVSFALPAEDERVQEVDSSGSIQGYRVTIIGGSVGRAARAALVGPNGERIDDVHVGSVIGARSARAIAVSEEGLQVVEDGTVFASSGDDAFQPTNVAPQQDLLANTAAW